MENPKIEKLLSDKGYSSTTFRIYVETYVESTEAAKEAKEELEKRRLLDQAKDMRNRALSVIFDQDLFDRIDEIVGGKEATNQGAQNEEAGAA